MKFDVRLNRAAARATRAMTENLESRVLFAEIAGTLLVDLNVTGLTPGTTANDLANAGTLGGVFEAPDAASTPVVDRPVPNATAGTVGIRMDGGDYLRLLQSAAGAALPAPDGITGSGDVSVEAWVWNPSLSDEETMVAWGQRGPSDGINMAFNFGSNPNYGAVGHWGDLADAGWGPNNPTPQHWHHLAYTYDGNVESFYIDGTLANSETIGALSVAPNTPINIGSQNDSAEGNPATGGLRGTLTLGALRVHDGALNADQVAANYNAEAANYVDPTVSTATPLTKLVDVDPTAQAEGAVTTLANTGTLGGFFKATGAANTVPNIDQPVSIATSGTKGIQLDGNDYLQSVDANGNLLPAPASITGSNPSTVEVWAWNKALAGEETMVSWSHRGGPDGTNYAFNYGNSPDYGAAAHWGGADMGYSSAPAPGQWHHLVYTFDGSTQRVYVDGVENNSEAIGLGVLNIWQGANLPINIGAQMSPDGTTLDGTGRGDLTLGRVRVYSGAMTADQVAADYNAEVGSYAEPVVPPLVKLVDIDATSLPAGAANDIPNTGTLGGFFEATGGGETVPVIGQPVAGATTGTKGIVLDGNDFLQLVSAAGDPTSLITAPQAITGMDPQQSVEVWVYNPGLASDETVLSFGRRGADGQNATFNYASNGTYGAVGRGGQSDLGWLNNPSANAWHHLVYTYDGANARVYIDGAVVNGETYQSGVVNTFPDTAINIGTQLDPDGVTPTNLLRGTLTVGSARVYAGVLTDEQIANDYNTERDKFVDPNTPTPAALSSGPTHRYSFDNAAGGADPGTVIEDLVGNADATVLGGGASFTGSQLVLPGGSSDSAAYVDLPNGIISSNGAANGGTGQLSFEGWVHQTGVQSWSRIYDFGSTNLGENNGEVTGPGGGPANGGDYVMLTAETGTDPVHRVEVNDPGNPGSRWNEVTDAFDDQDLHFVFTWDETTHTAKYFENGREATSLPTVVLISDINDVNNWLGRSQFFADANFQGAYDEFRIYDHALTAAEVAGNFQAGPNVVNVAANPSLVSTTINDGTAQRSQVRSLTLTFDRAVSLAAGAAKLELLNTGGSGANDGSTATDISSALLAPTSPDGGKTWVFTFDPASAFVQHTGGGASTGSLADGIYTLNVDPTKVTAGGATLAAAPTPFTFHRLFGDINGNRTVNLQDYGLFRNAFGKSTGQAGFDAAFDFDNNGTINTADYGQFRLRFSKTLSY